MSVTTSAVATPAAAPTPPNVTGTTPIPREFDPNFAADSKNPVLADFSGSSRTVGGYGSDVDESRSDFQLQVKARPQSPSASFEDAARGAVLAARAGADVVAVYSTPKTYEYAPVGLNNWTIDGGAHVISAQYQITPNNPNFALKALFTNKNMVDFRSGGSVQITHTGPAKEPKPA